MGKPIKLGLICAITVTVVQAQDLPKIVSMNLCTDQLVLLLADPDQILSLSRLADDPRSSAMAREAADFPKNSGQAEEIFLSSPDIVVAGQYSDRATLDMLARIGVRVETVPITVSLDDIPVQVRNMGALLGQDERADAIARDMEARLAVIPPIDDTAPVAAFYYANGYSLGADTLSHDILTTGGFRNLTQELGMNGGGRLALEQLVMSVPDVLISSPRYAGHSRSEDVAFHPALAQYAEDQKLIFSSSDWVCGTPLTLRAVEAVARARAGFKNLETKNDG